MSLLEGLNRRQREAAETIDGALLVLAGAGTGKTRVITYRIAYMLQQGISPLSIVGMTFTNKAAREMKERLSVLVDEDAAQKISLGTFHSFCVKILRREIGLLGYTSSFTIALGHEQEGLIKEAIASSGYVKDLDLTLEYVSGFISKSKNQLYTPAQAAANAENMLQQRAGIVYKRYQQVLFNQNMVDFDDLLILVIQIWKKSPEVLQKYQNRYKYLLVDEYQDTNLIQFTLLKMLIEKTNNICVVGDDDQSIYGWRGAEVKHILEFGDYFPGAKIVKLEQNYRSTNTILHAANTIISENDDRYKKNLWSDKGDGDIINVIKTKDPEEEALFIVDAILDDTYNYQSPYSNFAILYRSNHLSRVIEKQLREARIPYRLVGGKSFFHRKEIMDAVAYLKLVVNSKDDQSLLRILSTPPRGIGDKSIEALKDIQKNDYVPFVSLLGSKKFAKCVSNKAGTGGKNLSETIIKYQKIFDETHDIAQTAHLYLKEVGFLDGFLKMYKKEKDATKRQENVFELLNAIDEYEKQDGEANLLGFLENFALYDDNDKVDGDEESAVTLMTVHASKGLEFPFIFIMGMEDSLFPHARSIEEGSENEERRLFYVAITRAQQNLIMTYSMERYRFGKLKMQKPSKFLKSLPDDYVDYKAPDTFFKPADNETISEGIDDILRMLDGF